MFFFRLGEEITISYMSPLTRSGFSGTKDRQKILGDEFGFQCSCQACCHKSDEIENSDRTRIIQVNSKLAALYDIDWPVNYLVFWTSKLVLLIPFAGQNFHFLAF